MSKDKLTREQMRAKLDAALPKYDDNGLGSALPGRPIIWRLSFLISCFAVVFLPFAMFDDTRHAFQGHIHGVWNGVSVLGWYCLYLLALEQVVDGFFSKIWQWSTAPRAVSGRRTRKTRYGVFVAVSVVVVALAWFLR